MSASLINNACGTSDTEGKNGASRSMRVVVTLLANASYAPPKSSQKGPPKARMQA